MKYFATILILFSAASFLKAQTEQQLLPEERKQLTVVTEPVTLYKGFLRIGTTTNYIFLDKIFDPNGNRTAISSAFGRIWIQGLVAQYGITDRLQAEVSIAYRNQILYLNSRQELPVTNTFDDVQLRSFSKGIGDLSVGVYYQVLTETASRPSVRFSVYTTLPTAPKDVTEESQTEIRTPTGSGKISLDYDLNFRKISYPFVYSVNLSYVQYLEGEKIFDVAQGTQTFKDGNMINLSGTFGFHLNDWLAMVHDVDYFQIGIDEVDGAEVDEDTKYALEYGPRFAFQIKRLRFNQAVRFPLSGRLSGSDVGYILILQYMF